MDVKPALQSEPTAPFPIKEVISNGIEGDRNACGDGSPVVEQYLQDEVLMHAPSSASSDSEGCYPAAVLEPRPRSGCLISPESFNTVESKDPDTFNETNDLPLENAWSSKRSSLSDQLDDDLFAVELDRPFSQAGSYQSFPEGVNTPTLEGSIQSPTPHMRRTRQRTISSSSSFKGSSSTTASANPILRNRTRTIYTAGRPPWYDSAGQHMKPCVIGISGGSASGKTTVADKIITSLNIQWVTRLSMDCFYKVLNEKQHIQASSNEYNFDHPDAFDFPLLFKTLKRLCDGKKVEVPVYNFVTHCRDPKSKTMYGANVIIFEGILAFHNPAVNELLDVKVFVDTDADTRLARRLRRDITERGRDLDGVIKQYNQFVKPSFDLYIAPQMAHADIIVPRGGDNEVAIDLIVQHVQRELLARGLRVREKLLEGCPKDAKDPKSLYLLPSTPQICGLHTFIRSTDTPRDEFIFYSKRLIRLSIEYALSLMPFKDVTVETHQQFFYKGKRSATNKICGVSILRAGETMEQALNEVCKDIRIGKVLIQTNPSTGEPELYYCRLPKDVADYRIILMDACVATGAAAMMGIRILLDHDVPEENIMLLSLLMAKSGVHAIAYAFPKVKLVTTAVDPEINEKFYVMPGMGNFGDRYFGTEPCDTFERYDKTT